MPIKKKPEYGCKRDSVSAIIYLGQPSGWPPLTGCPYPRFKDRLFGLHAGGVYPCTHRLPGDLVSVALYGYLKPGGSILPSSGRPAPAYAGRRTTPFAHRASGVRVSTFLYLTAYAVRQRLPTVLWLYSIDTICIINHLSGLRKCKLYHTNGDPGPNTLVHLNLEADTDRVFIFFNT